MRQPWWLDEEPQTIKTDKNVLRWYPNAGKLQVSRPDWTDDSGAAKPGKTVTLDIEGLRLSGDAQAAAAILRSIADAL